MYEPLVYRGQPLLLSGLTWRNFMALPMRPAFISSLKLTPPPPLHSRLHSEVSPPQFRGHLVSFSEICINIGLMLGFVADAVLLPLPSGVNWRIMLGLGMVMPSILIILTCTGTS